MASSGGSPCGACKFLRRKCAADCVFAPYFCAEDGAAQFAAIHKVFGASNAAKLLHMAPPADRSEAAATVTYEAQARLRDPVYGCVAHIFALQQQVASLQMQLVQAKAHAAQRVVGAQAMGNPSLQPWQMDGPESLSTQSSGCYSAGPSGDHGVLQEMYCFSEQEDGNYTR